MNARKKKLNYKIKPSPQIQELAEWIAADLFGGDKHHADHLRLYKDDAYLAGWAERPMADQIARWLASASVTLPNN